MNATFTFDAGTAGELTSAAHREATEGPARDGIMHSIETRIRQAACQGEATIQLPENHVALNHDEVLALSNAGYSVSVHIERRGSGFLGLFGWKRECNQTRISRYHKQTHNRPGGA